MGRLATTVQEALCERLRTQLDGFDWETERHVAATPVDVAGVREGTTIVVELEWRRADPADNTAKLFRHLAAGTLDAETVVVVQVFTGKYDLASGGVSSKRENAEFVGERAAASEPGVEYEPVTLAVDPPKRGGDLPEDWKTAVDEVVDTVVSRVESAVEG